MKRATPVLLAILLGAFVTALGMGIFLKLANDDRARLSAEINRARDEAAAALADKEKIAREANEKVEAANDEVRKAQEVLERLEEEQKLLATATPLSKPPTRELRGWTTVTSLPLGVSFLVPSTLTVLQNNESLVSIATKGDETSKTKGWMDIFSASNPSAGNDGQGSRTISKTIERSYIVDGVLLIGKDVTFAAGDREITFWVQKAGARTHWIHLRPDPAFGPNGVERLLRTMEFAD